MHLPGEDFYFQVTFLPQKYTHPYVLGIISNLITIESMKKSMHMVYSNTLFYQELEHL